MLCKHWLGLFVGIFGLVAMSWAAETRYVPFDAAMPVGARYTVDATKLHPTQFVLGFREVHFKRDGFDRATFAEVTKTLKKKDVPVVIGPGGVPYLSDGHHTIRALLESKHADKTVYGTIIANWSTLAEDEFWRRMVEKNYTNLADATAGGLRDPAELPATLREMKGDIYRGLAWGVMTAGGFDERKDVYFQEFRWADFFRSRLTWNDEDEADFQRAVKKAIALAGQPEAASLPGYRASAVR